MNPIATQDSAAPATVADRLRGARRRGFVGRAAELELFRAALDAPEPPFSVLWICGPGGVGKTTLLGALADAARAVGREPAIVDLRGMEPSPPAFAADLGRARQTERPVLLLDTFEIAGALEDWLREELVPGLPAGTLVVVASRARPGDAWRADPGWRELLRVVSLRNLDPDDARALLRGAGVADDLHEWVLDLTHGHPLALSLLLDVLGQRPTAVPLELCDVPDLVGRLRSQLPRRPAERAPPARARARRPRSFHDRGRPARRSGRRTGRGAVRVAARAVVRRMRATRAVPARPGARGHRRRPALARCRRLPARARTCARGSGRAARARTGREHQRALADLMFLHRGNPAAPAFWDWESLGEVYADAARGADRAPILAMVERQEGAASAAIAEHWLERQPESFAAFRGRGAEPLGFLAQLALHAASDAELARDPGARALWAHALRHGAPRADEEVLACRFSMDRDAYQAPSRSFNVVTMRTTQEWLGRPRLSWYYIVFADPEAVASLMTYIGFQRAADADFDVGGRRYGVYARDWRRESGAEWLERMAERELGGEPPAVERDTSEPLALSQPEFAGAVRRALRSLHNRSDLAANPLIRARVVRERAGDRPAPEALRELVGDAIDELRVDPRDAKLVRALERTYLRPAPTQEAAAELLGLPFSTYRGHLARGIERVVEWLWQRELYGR